MDHRWGKDSYVIAETVSYVDTNSWNYMYIQPYPKIAMVG